MKTEIVYKATELFQAQDEPVCFVIIEELDLLLPGDLLAGWDRSATFKAAEKMARKALKSRAVEWLGSCPGWSTGTGWLQFRKKNFPRTTWLTMYRSKEYLETL
jgi:hypothetical protein